MKARSIKSILQKKFNLWCDSITDESLRELVEKNTIITGGSIVSMLLNDKVSDYDVYFTNRETTLKVAEYYLKQFAHEKGCEPLVVDNDKSDRLRIQVNANGAAANGLRMDSDEVEDTGAQEAVNSAENNGAYRPVFISQNAITLSDEIQIIIRFYGEADEIHKNYDFVHCTNYWTSKDSKLTLHPAAVEAILTKELRYTGSKYPLCSIIRTRKFIKRGWTINAGQYLKMALQLNELNLFDVEVLEDQLVGVDSAHFIHLIGSVKEKNDEKLNAAYICALIDRIF